MKNYSVLMSVYHREKAEYLQISVKSMLTQTLPPDDFVLVCDGPLTEELDSVIDGLVQNHPDIFQIVRLQKNCGLDYALNEGIKICRNELVARMDSDDIAAPDRCELQVKKFEENPDLVIVGGAIEEFEGSVSNIVSHKGMPETHEEIMRYVRKRNPFNHPTVMYKKNAVIAAGGYPHKKFHEDYALWGNMILGGAKGCNLPETLCFMRVDSGLYNRRGGWYYLKVAVQLRWEFYRKGLYTLGDFLFVTLGLIVVCLIPVPARKFIYRHVLRRSAGAEDREACVN